MKTFIVTAAWLLLVSVASARSQDLKPLEGTQPLTEQADFSDRMLAGMEKLLLRETEQSVANRAQYWKRDTSSNAAYEKSIHPNRERFARIIGVVDQRLPISELHYVGGTQTPFEIAHTNAYNIYAVRWPVLEGVEGEGLLVVPISAPTSRVICLPDADQTPEMLLGLAPGIAPEQQFARRLVEQGCLVVIPTLIDRTDTWSGDPKVWMTNEPHREWVYRPAYELGRHIIGYEVQKSLAIIDWFSQQGPEPTGIAGYGEGGLIAFYTAAVEPRIQSVLVSGYFDSRQELWQEPIYRNVFGLLQEFGDAEIASLIAPRSLTIEYSTAPNVTGPPAVREGRREAAAPGRIRTPALDIVQKEVQRFHELLASESFKPIINVVANEEGQTIGPGSAPALQLFQKGLVGTDEALKPLGDLPKDTRTNFDPGARQERQVQQLVEHTQLLLRRSNRTREEFWKTAKSDSVATWTESTATFREYLLDEVLGRYPVESGPVPVRTRKAFDKPKSEGYEVVIDVGPDLILWGYLQVPKDLKPGERRPVVVCQHGLEGLPMDTIDEDPKAPGHAYYKAFATRLAERGFVTFAPHHYYRGGNRFRQLQRIANPLKKTMFALTIAQHERLLDWLSELPFVDAKRIGFYGLSYGGFSAMRLPAVLDRYALSIDSAEFNDMALKKASTHDLYSYPFYLTYEVFEFNFANTFNYGDLAGLIAPRPFMVERGHRDGVAPDEWVSSEYAKVRRLYTTLKIGERTAIEYFDGPHTIHGVGTFEFLERHLTTEDAENTEQAREH